MAISLDNHTDTTVSANAAASLTFAATASAGSNRLLLVGVYVSNNTGDDVEHITGVTYNAVSMTQLAKIESTGTNPQWNYIYGLLNPATGSNNVVISGDAGQGGRIGGNSAGFSNVAQSGLPDVKNTQLTASAASLTTSVTTTYSNPGDFVYLADFASFNVTAVAGTGSTAIGGLAFVMTQYQSSSNPISPPTAVSMTAGSDITTRIAQIMIGITAFGASQTSTSTTTTTSTSTTTTSTSTSTTTTSTSTSSSTSSSTTTTRDIPEATPTV